MILAALFAALTAASAFLSIPVGPVSFTLQTMMVALSGIVLGPKLGAASQILYVLIGLCGIPVFTKGGGIGYVLQPSFGYLVGFIVGAFLIGTLVERMKTPSLWKVFGATLCGLLLIYVLGTAYMFMIVNVFLGKTMSVGAVVYSGIVLFIGPDVVLNFVASAAAVRIVPVLRRNGYLPVPG